MRPGECISSPELIWQRRSDGSFQQTLIDIRCDQKKMNTSTYRTALWRYLTLIRNPLNVPTYKHKNIYELLPRFSPEISCSGKRIGMIDRSAREVCEISGVMTWARWSNLRNGWNHVLKNNKIYECCLVCIMCVYNNHMLAVLNLSSWLFTAAAVGVQDRIKYNCNSNWLYWPKISVIKINRAKVIYSKTIYRTIQVLVTPR